MQIDSGDGSGISIERALKLLKEGDLTEARGLLPWGSNYTVLMEICDGDFDAAAVYKPRRGERPLWDFPDGTLYKREVAAFEVSEMLGWRIVPPTVIRNGPYGPGMVQLYVTHDPEQHYFTFNASQKGQLAKFTLFDYMINNADRKGGHCLLADDGNIWGIDHGICFHMHYKLRTVIWDFAGEEIPETYLKDMELFCQKIAQPSDYELLTSLLSGAEIEALRRRVDRLLETGTYPEAGFGRSYPWPPV